MRQYRTQRISKGVRCGGRCVENEFVGGVENAEKIISTENTSISKIGLREKGCRIVLPHGCSGSESVTRQTRPIDSA